MDRRTPPQIEDRIARCRLILSVVAFVAIFSDPTAPLVSSWIPMVTGRFAFDPWVMGVLGSHLAYSLLCYFAAARSWLRPDQIERATSVADVVFSAIIAVFTEGATSPFFPFFTFAVVTAGFRSGMRRAVVVTAASVALYLGLITISTPEDLNSYIMRPAYLAIVGYLVGYFGQQRLEMQRELQDLEAAEQRHRIARDLHDGFAQALAGINLKVEGCRRLLRRGETADALAELTELQGSVNREYDDLRAYMQTLAGIQASPARGTTPRATRFALRVEVEGSTELVDHVLQIAREAVSNVRRHAAAATAAIRVSTEGSQVEITIDDDGVGLASPAAPWSIASRVRELGGRVEVSADGRPGSHLQILLPQS